MKKIKVAMLDPYLPDSKHNGVAMHTSKLTHHLSLREDIELHMITFGNEKRQFKKGNLNIHVIKKIKLLFGPLLIFQIGSLKRKVMEINPDIVHAMIIPYSTTAALVRDKYPTLLTMHGIAAKEVHFEKGFDFILYRLANVPNERYVASKIPNIIVCSPYMKEIIENMTNSKSYIIPNAINFEDTQNTQHKSIEHPCILFVGGLRKLKGVDLILKAIPIVKKSIPNLSVLIAGLGPEENELKTLVKKLDIEENVNFLGFISGKEKYSYYKSVDVCVFPSIHESFGIVLLEAMACGKPVVASNVGGIPFVVEDGKTGLLFERGNVEELAEKIITLLQNKELREKMGEAGREKAKEFTWDRVAEKTVEVYREVISKWMST